jgi:hypothetical protein
LHNFWDIELETLVGEYREPLEDEAECSFCAKSKGYKLDCMNCKTACHGMCAYLNGCSFSMKKDSEMKYKVELNCCTNPKLKERLSLQRKFKLNYEKIIFRENTELLNFLQNQ